MRKYGVSARLSVTRYVRMVVLAERAPYRIERRCFDPRATRMRISVVHTTFIQFYEVQPTFVQLGTITNP